METFNSVAKKFYRLERAVEKESRKATKQSLADVQEKASSEGFHRYNSRSGMLNKAYSTAIKSPLEGVLTLEKRKTNTPYSHAIHSGRRDWKNYIPDLFLYRAAKNLSVLRDIRDNYKKVVNKAIKRAGF